MSCVYTSSLRPRTATGLPLPSPQPRMRRVLSPADTIFAFCLLLAAYQLLGQKSPVALSTSPELSLVSK